MEIWFQTGALMNKGINIYEPEHHLGYPPLWAFWCMIAYRFYTFFGNSYEIWRFILKLPLIVSHLVLAYSIGRFAENEFSQKKAHRIFYTTLTWSFFVYIGAIWGQVNTVSALLTFLAFEAIIKQRTKKSALLLGVAGALKLYPLITFPAFLIYLLKRDGKKEAGKFFLHVISVPILVTLFAFTILQWDFRFFFQTLFSLGAPYAWELGGCMNFWSFIGLASADLSAFRALQLLWIPIIAVCTLYWFKKPSLDNAELNIALITFYLFFMISYGWVTEQSFVDPLPFIFLQVLGYRPKRSHLYMLTTIQILVYAFSAVNGGLSLFEPLLEHFSPSFLVKIETLYIHNVLPRGILGLIITLFLTVFLISLWKTSSFKKNDRGLVARVCIRHLVGRKAKGIIG